jgi:hypothetical protein
MSELVVSGDGTRTVLEHSRAGPVEVENLAAVILAARARFPRVRGLRR